MMMATSSSRLGQELSPQEEWEKRLQDISRDLFIALTGMDDGHGLAAAEDALRPLTPGERQRVLLNIRALHQQYPSDDPGHDRPKLVQMAIEELERTKVNRWLKFAAALLAVAGGVGLTIYLIRK